MHAASAASTGEGAPVAAGGGDEVLLAGHLHKRSQFVRKWNLRAVVLYPDRLAWFHVDLGPQTPLGIPIVTSSSYQPPQGASPPGLTNPSAPFRVHPGRDLGAVRGGAAIRSLPLSDVLVVERKTSLRKPFAFCVRTCSGLPDVILAADTEADLYTWQSAIKVACQKLVAQRADKLAAGMSPESFDGASRDLSRDFSSLRDAATRRVRDKAMDCVNALHAMADIGVDRHPGLAWTPDAESSACGLCGVQFVQSSGMLAVIQAASRERRRRHHCRTCGAVACGDCVSFKVKLKPSALAEFCQLIRPEPGVVERLEAAAEAQGIRAGDRVLSGDSAGDSSATPTPTHRRRGSFITPSARVCTDCVEAVERHNCSLALRKRAAEELAENPTARLVEDINATRDELRSLLDEADTLFQEQGAARGGGAMACSFALTERQEAHIAGLQIALEKKIEDMTHFFRRQVMELVARGTDPLADKINTYFKETCLCLVPHARVAVKRLKRQRMVAAASQHTSRMRADGEHDVEPKESALPPVLRLDPRTFAGPLEVGVGGILSAGASEPSRRVGLSMSPIVTGADGGGADGGADGGAGAFASSASEMERQLSEFLIAEQKLEALTNAYILLFRLAYENTLLNEKISSYTFESLAPFFGDTIDAIQSEIEETFRSRPPDPFLGTGADGMPPTPLDADQEIKLHGETAELFLSEWDRTSPPLLGDVSMFMAMESHYRMSSLAHAASSARIANSALARSTAASPAVVEAMAWSSQYARPAPVSGAPTPVYTSAHHQVTLGVSLEIVRLTRGVLNFYILHPLQSATLPGQIKSLVFLKQLSEILSAHLPD